MSIDALVDELVTQGVRHLGDGRFDAAASVVAEARALDGATPYALAQLDLLDGDLLAGRDNPLPALRRIVAARRRLSTVDDGDAAEALRARVGISEAAVLMRLARWQRAHAVLSTALRRAADRFGPDSVEAARLHNQFGLLCKATGDYADAEGHYHRALPVLRHHHGETSHAVATVCHNLGGIAFVRGDLAAAEHWARHAVALRAALVDPDHPTLALDRAALAPILVHIGQLAEAGRILHEVLPRIEALYGPHHPEVATVLANLGTLAARSGEWPAAYARLGHALRLKRAASGPDLLRTLVNYAVAAARTGHVTEAADARAEALRVARLSLPDGHPLRLRIEAEYSPVDRW